MAYGQKTGGREKGTTNKITKEIKDVLKAVIDPEIENLQKLLNKLEPIDRINIIIKLLPFVIPKIQTIKTENKHEIQETPQIIVNDEETKKHLEDLINSND